ncbi:hypothetical protein [Micromonospora sp. NPDC048843]|uniref:hypothetical protein n=1 Tax=Micromonospora sp. NPDC048843 TaxID=3155389 RepID=UPI0033E68089
MSGIRVVQWGLGAMGSGMARLVLRKPGLRLVGCTDIRADLAGRDAGEVLGTGPLGLPVTPDAARLLAEQRPDVVLIATTSWLADQQTDLETIVAAGAHCVSIAEEMAAPEAADPTRPAPSASTGWPAGTGSASSAPVSTPGSCWTCWWCC